MKHKKKMSYMIEPSWGNYGLSLLIPLMTHCDTFDTYPLASNFPSKEKSFPDGMSSPLYACILLGLSILPTLVGVLASNTHDGWVGGKFFHHG